MSADDMAFVNDPVTSLGMTLEQGRRVWKRAGTVELEQLYDIEATVPDIEDILEGYGKRSRLARAAARAKLDVPYGELPEERLDIYLAEASDAPVLVFFHGGYWRRGCREDQAFLAEHHVAQGAHFVAVGYPLMREGTTMEGIAESALRAYEWVSKNAGSFGGDPERIVVCGNSAGGQLAAMIATQDRGRRLGRTAPAPVVLVALSGVFDVEPLRGIGQHAALKLTEESARRVSPIDMITHASPRTRLIAAVGGRETPEFVRQTLSFHSAWVRSARRADLLVLGDEDHFSLIASFADPGHPLFTSIHRALRVEPGG
jgi:arylformamidase